MNKRKFNDDQVRQMRREYRTPCSCCGKMVTQSDLAKKYEVSTPTISNALNGRGEYIWVEDG